MTNNTAAANPPLPFTNDAIIDRLRHQATNGPAYVQHSATKALAHIKGLYAQARYEARLAFEASRLALRDAIQDAAPNSHDQADDGTMSLAKRMEGLNNGTLQPTPEELAHFEPDNPAQAEDDDEDHPEEQEDEPP